MDKQELRKQIRAAKRAVPFCEKCTRSLPIMQQVEALPQFQQASIVLLYWSMEDEVQTHDFINRWYGQKTILLPCVDGDDLRLRQYTGEDCLSNSVLESLQVQSLRTLTKWSLLLCPAWHLTAITTAWDVDGAFTTACLKAPPTPTKWVLVSTFKWWTMYPLNLSTFQ